MVVVIKRQKFPWLYSSFCAKAVIARLGMLFSPRFLFITKVQCRHIVVICSWDSLCRYLDFNKTATSSVGIKFLNPYHFGDKSPFSVCNLQCSCSIVTLGIGRPRPRMICLTMSHFNISHTYFGEHVVLNERRKSIFKNPLE